MLDVLVAPLKEYLERLIYRGKFTKEIESIKLSFGKYSQQYLKQAKYTIPRIGHIERGEVSDIANAWKNGVSGIILTGTAGSGKSGLVLDLAKELQRIGTPVLFIRATDFSSIADPAAAIKQRLSSNKDLGESLAILGTEQECVVIVDQLDSVSESVSLAGFVSLLKSICEFNGVRVLAVSRIYEAENSKFIKELGFSRIESRELDIKTAQAYLNILGISNSADDLLGLSQNLLNLSLMAEIVSSGNHISDIMGLTQLWEKYALSIKDRDGEESFKLGMELADRSQISGEKDFSLDWSQISSTAKLHSRGVIIQIPGKLRFRFRHEQLQTFFCAYSLYRDLLTPQKIVERYGRYNSKAVLIWLCILYGQKNSQNEAEFVEQVLNDGGLIPYYTQTAVLDQYSHLDKLTKKSDVVQVILETIKIHNNLQNHFYRSNPNPVWVKPLWEFGFLSRPPEPEKAELTLPPWFAQYYLISVASQVPEIVLQHVSVLEGHGWYLARAIEALCKIPVQYSEKALPKVLGWLSNPETAEIAQTEALEFISILVKNGKTEAALTLFNALSAQRDEKKSPNTRHSYRELFGVRDDRSGALELLKNSCPAELITILENRLVSIIYEEAGTKKISWWRNAIEDTEQDLLTDYQDYVLNTLRDTIKIFIESNSIEGAKIVNRYLKDNHDILRRLGLFLIGQYPAIFKPEIIVELLDSKNLDNVDIHHEFFTLLRSTFSLLGDSEKKVLIKMILDGPDLEKVKKRYESYWQAEHPDREKFLSNWQNAWIRDRLSMISNHLDDQTRSVFDGLVAIGGKSEHPEFLAWSSGAFWVEDVSPYSDLELSKFSPGQLLEFIRTWQPDPKEGFGPKRISYEGFAKELAKLICPSPEFYGQSLLDICLVRPENAVAIISLWAKPEYDKDVPWELAINLFEELLKDKQVWDNESQQAYYGETWRNVRLNIAQLLGISLTNDKKRVPFNLLESVQTLLLKLVDDPDPTLEADRPQDGWFGYNDPITVAINHVRPIALAALIRCAVRMAKQKLSGENALQENRVMSNLMIEKLEQKLDPQIEPSRAMRSVFGEFVPTLYWLDRLWLINHLDAIFPITHDDENAWLFNSAWDAYILNKYYHNIFEIMRSKYALAIEYLSQGYKTESHLGQSGHLSVHLLSEYLLSDLDLEHFMVAGNLLLEFFQKTQPEIRSRAPWALWRICESDSNNLSKFWPKARSLWEWRSKESTISNHSPDFNAEMTEFAQLLQVAPEFETVKSMQSLLDGLLPHLRKAESHDVGWHSVEIFLARQVEKEPVDVIKYYRLMCEQKFNPPQWVYHSDSTKKIIENAAKNPKSRVEALALIDFFAQKWRDYTFQSIYQKYAG